ncbi:MAG TPA: radical SAM protein [Candidatus Hydrogenedentes bacterium]|nr:radical SAM protein [Candidatus Hydrogenedentota bacterium]
MDLVPFKTCTYDCVYCQLGRTTARTLERREYVPLADVLGEVARKLETEAPPDYVTLAGSGEPTLYSRLGELIAAVKDMTTIPVAVLTNGSLLSQSSVREALLEADNVAPSLDAGTAEWFQRVNRPHPAIGFDELIEGLVAFRQGFKNLLWLEVFLVGRAPALDDEVRRLAGHIERIRPDRVQLNTVARPPAEPWATPTPREDLLRYARMLGEHVDIITDFAPGKDEPRGIGGADEVLALLQRRPCTLEDLAEGLSVSRLEVLKHLEDLRGRNLIELELRGGHAFFKARRN